MDRVRFGRVLGRGARLAARTVYEAVDAATMPSPSSSSAVSGSSVTRGTVTVERPLEARRPAGTAQQTQRQTLPRPKASRGGLFSPVKRASRAVSLEITGSFFALFAFAFAAGMWRSRSGLSTGGAELQHFLLYGAVMLLFAYFAGSNFLKAKRLA